MADPTLFHSTFMQADDVCLLASFGFAIEYYTRLQNNAFPDNYFEELFKGYIEYIIPKFDSVEVEKLKNKGERYNTFKYIKEGSIDVNTLSNKDLQCATSILLHFYCQDYMCAKGSVEYHGYHHLLELYNNVCNCGGKLGRIEIPTNLSIRVYENYKKSEMDKKTLTGFLSRDNTLALVLYPLTRDGMHSALVFRHEDKYIFRDSNQTAVTKEASGNTLFANMNDIREVLTFQIGNN